MLGTTLLLTSEIEQGSTFTVEHHMQGSDTVTAAQMLTLCRALTLKHAAGNHNTDNGP